MGRRVFSEARASSTLWVPLDAQAEETYIGLSNGLGKGATTTKLHECLAGYPRSLDAIADTLKLRDSIVTPVLVVVIQGSAGGQLASQYSRYVFHQKRVLHALANGECWHLRPRRDPELIVA